MFYFQTCQKVTNALVAGRISCYRYQIRILVTLIFVFSMLLVSNNATAQETTKNLQERIELTCTDDSGTQLAEKVKSYELEKETTLNQRLKCSKALSDLLSSGMDLTSLTTNGSKQIYSFIGEGAALATVLPPEQPDINCNPQGGSDNWTCKCTGGHILFCEIFCAGVIENYYTCSEDESTNDRVVRYINLLSGN